MDWVRLGLAVVQLLTSLTEWLKHQQWYEEGVAAEQAKEKAAADALQDHYDQIAAEPRTLGDASARLHARASGLPLPPEPVPQPAPGAQGGGGVPTP